MKFTHASLDVLDPNGYRWAETDVSFTGGSKGEDGREHDTWVEAYPTNANDTIMPSHEVRHYSDLVLPGHEGPTLLDRHEVWGGSVRMLGQRLVLTGFSRNTDGLIKNGEPQPGSFSHPDEIEGRTFVGVRWDLLP